MLVSRNLSRQFLTLPHFVLWVIFGGIIINLLSPNDEIVNELLLRLNIIQKPIHYLAKPEYFWSIAVLSNALKSVGFGAILYIASIMGVNPELYEAATIDRAGWLKLHSKYSIYVILFSFRS